MEKKFQYYFSCTRQYFSRRKIHIDKVYNKVIESLEKLNTKKEEHIIEELNSFDKDKFNKCKTRNNSQCKR